MSANASAKRKVVELDETLTVADICSHLGISRRTFYEWRMKGTGPECFPIPNGELRIEVAEYKRWLKSRKQAA